MTPAMKKFAAAILDGGNEEAAAAAAGVTTKTVARWKNRDTWLEKLVQEQARIVRVRIMVIAARQLATGYPTHALARLLELAQPDARKSADAGAQRMPQSLLEFIQQAHAAELACRETSPDDEAAEEAAQEEAQEEAARAAAAAAAMTPAAVVPETRKTTQFTQGDSPEQIGAGAKREIEPPGTEQPAAPPAAAIPPNAKVSDMMESAKDRGVGLFHPTDKADPRTIS